MIRGITELEEMKSEIIDILLLSWSQILHGDLMSPVNKESFKGHVV